ncbi:hypothetical protein [Kribbella sp. NPDC051770]|uniref:hypothetical protein n=1 Tax=Kribbella sp. NPDC051770 TaxID=3155413 RepID=UPI00343F535F
MHQPQYAVQPVGHYAQYADPPVGHFSQYAAQPTGQFAQHAAQPVHPAAGLPADHPFAGVHRRISRAARRRVHSRDRRVRRLRAAVRNQSPTW